MTPYKKTDAKKRFRARGSKPVPTPCHTAEKGGTKPPLLFNAFELAAAHTIPLEKRVLPLQTDQLALQLVDANAKLL